MNTFGFSLEHGINSLKLWYSWYVTVAHQVLTIDYQIIEATPRLAIQQILDYLKIERNEGLIDILEKKYNKLSVKEKYAALGNDESTVDIGFSYYDKETFFHRRHVSSSGIQLTTDQISEIRSQLREYIQ